MLPNHLIPTLRNLNRIDKLQIMQVLLSELAKEEGGMFQAGAEYPVWSPLNATDAAITKVFLSSYDVGVIYPGVQ